ncbi:MAG: hypothetical protein GY768_11425 [Planctomycetaceae bacterium]|nr:hypothetical protein [Planctomycetaceae bacterium]
MLVGPVFTRELVTSPRRARLFLTRSVYAGVLFGVMCTAWLILTGTQTITTVGDMARFGGILMQILAPLQLAMIVFLAAFSTASAVAQEKDRKTLILLLLTRLNSSELVLGKLFASLLHVFSMLLAGLPVFALAILFGGISFTQVGRVFTVTLVAAFAAGSLGSTLALWREKTFQTLALTALLIVFGLIICEVIGSGIAGKVIAGVDASVLATWFSPLRAVMAAARPSADLGTENLFENPVVVFVLIAISAGIGLNVLTIWRVRVWNPSREVRQRTVSDELQESIWGAEHDIAQGEREVKADQARTRHVDSQLRERKKQPYREVWANPILWREVCTWAYGRKVIVIRIAYAILFVLAAISLFGIDSQPLGGGISEGQRSVLPAVARPLVPFFVVSLVVVNALAVTSITNERDGRSLDLLLVTDLAPAEFLLGKLGGIFWVTKEMILLPVVLCSYLLWTGTLTAENFCYVVGGLFVMDLFVAVLGIHCGMTYANSRAAIGVSLGTVFFLFLGINTCILMMISFSGSFHVQLAPFLAFIMGGGVGLYVSLGARNPSPAILAASLLLPFATFYAITSYLLDLTLAVFLVMAVAYSFTTAAMMIPALSEFDFAMGRNSVADD